MEKQLLLLGLLRQRQMHGYQLVESIDRYLGACTDIKKPTAYYLLNKMAQNGWIREEETQEGNRPPRRVYSLTPEGEVAYQTLLRENLSAWEQAYFPGDIGLAFLDDLPPAEGLELLQIRRALLAQALQAAGSVPPHQGSLQLAVDHQLHHLRAELDWLDQVISRQQAQL